MATQVVALEASFDTSQAEGSVKSLKAQLKEAQAEVQKMADKFGETSTQATNAAKKAAGLKDKIGDAKALTDTFNPDKKFTAFGQALAGVAGGFAAVQGAMGLMGSESKDVEKAMLKVQSAMAISQGLNQVTESIDSFKNLGKQLKELSIVQKISAAAQRIWNIAMEANPIGAIILAITLLIAAAVGLYKFFSESSKAAKANEKAVKDNAKAVESLSKQLDKNADTLQKNNDYKLAMAKASGASTKAIRALELKLIDEQIAMAASSREAAKNEYWKQKLALANLKAADADDELIKKQVENTNNAGKLYSEQNANLNKAGEAKVALIRKQNVEITQEETNANKKSADDRKAASDKRKADADAAAQKVKEDTIANNEQLKSVKQELELAAIKDEDERAKKKIQLDFDNEKLKIQNAKGSTESKNALILELEKKKNVDIQAVTDAAILKAAEKKKTDDEKAAADKLTKDQKDIDDAKKKADEEVKIAKEKADQKKAIQDAEFGALDAGVNFLKAIAVKNKALQKAAIIAENAMGIAKIITNTMAANAKALSYGPAAPAIITANNISAGFGVATTIASTAKALKAINSGGDTSAPPIGGGGTTAPIQPQASATTLNQMAINNAGNQAIKTYVVESDVSGNQERIDRIQRAARIGP